MKMKKYLSIAILLMMMALPVVFTSCGNDDPMEEVENPETKLDVWTVHSTSWVRMWMRSRAIWLNP